MIFFGIRGKVSDSRALLKKVAAMEKEHNITIQLFRADRIFGIDHLVSATEKAARTFESGRAMSKTLGMEIMLYAAAERQTSEALRKIGIYPGITEMAMVVIGPMPEDLLQTLGLERDDSVLEPEGKDPEIFGITKEEIGTVSDVSELVLERVALSEVYR